MVVNFALIVEDVYFFCVKVRDKDENVVQEHPTTSTIVVGPETADYHLNTFEDIECVHCYRPHFYGQPIEEVSCRHL